jgi:hypothetical protein
MTDNCDGHARTNQRGNYRYADNHHGGFLNSDWTCGPQGGREEDGARTVEAKPHNQWRGDAIFLSPQRHRTLLCVGIAELDNRW